MLETDHASRAEMTDVKERLSKVENFKDWALKAVAGAVIAGAVVPLYAQGIAGLASGRLFSDGRS